MIQPLLRGFSRNLVILWGLSDKSRLHKPPFENHYSKRIRLWSVYAELPYYCTDAGGMLLRYSDPSFPFLQVEVNSEVCSTCEWFFLCICTLSCGCFLVERETLLQWQQRLGNLFGSHTGSIVELRWGRALYKLPFSATGLWKFACWSCFQWRCNLMSAKLMVNCLACEAIFGQL